MVRLENWFYGIKTYDVIPYVLEKNNADFYLSGLSYGHKDLKDGSKINTKKIFKVEGNLAYSEDGIIYELGKMSPDYKLMLEANANNIPILYSWKIEGDLDGDLYIYASTLVLNKKNYIYQKILKQDMQKHTLILENIGEVFVVWPAMNRCLNSSFKFALSKEKYNKIFCNKMFGEACEPDIFSEHNIYIWKVFSLDDD